jgi:hypothetical protein
LGAEAQPQGSPGLLRLRLRRNLKIVLFNGRRALRSAAIFFPGGD